MNYDERLEKLKAVFMALKEYQVVAPERFPLRDVELYEMLESLMNKDNSYTDSEIVGTPDEAMKRAYEKNMNIYMSHYEWEAQQDGVMDWLGEEKFWVEIEGEEE